MTWKIFLAMVVVSVVITGGLFLWVGHARDARLNECKAAGGNLVVTTSRGHRACVKVDVVEADM